VVLSLLVVSVLGVTQLANYPLINTIKSGDHKLLTTSTNGPATLNWWQPFQQTAVVFSRAPKVAISIRDFQVSGVATNSSAPTGSIDYRCSVGSITTTAFNTTLVLTTTNTFSLLYYMYIGIDVVAFANTYLYFYSIDTTGMFDDVANITNTTTFTIAETVADFGNAVVMPMAMSFKISTTHEYSFFTKGSMTASSTIEVKMVSNSNLQRMEMTVFIVDKTALEASYTYYLDTGAYEVSNSNSTPVVTFLPPSFNYYNNILGITGMRVNSSFNPNFYFTASYTIATATQYIFVRLTALHWRKRQCVNSSIPKFVVQEQLCYDVCPSGYATNASIDYCVLCSYTCSTC
jgi:hypothetical protein